MLLLTIQTVEKSGLANAGIGCNLTLQGTAELEASFASINSEIVVAKASYASVTAV